MLRENAPAAASWPLVRRCALRPGCDGPAYARGFDAPGAGAIGEQDEAALGGGEVEDGVEDEIEQDRQALLGVEALVDREELAQRLRLPDGRRRAGGRGRLRRRRAPVAGVGGGEQLAQAARVGVVVDAVAAELGGAHADLLPGLVGAGEAGERALAVATADVGAGERDVGAEGDVATGGTGGAVAQAAERGEARGIEWIAERERDAHGGREPGVNLVGGLGEHARLGERATRGGERRRCRRAPRRG